MIMGSHKNATEYLTPETRESSLKELVITGLNFDTQISDIAKEFEKGDVHVKSIELGHGRATVKFLEIAAADDMLLQSPIVIDGSKVELHKLKNEPCKDRILTYPVFVSGLPAGVKKAQVKDIIETNVLKKKRCISEVHMESRRATVVLHNERDAKKLVRIGSVLSDDIEAFLTFRMMKNVVMVNNIDDITTIERLFDYFSHPDYGGPIEFLEYEKRLCQAHIEFTFCQDVWKVTDANNNLDGHILTTTRPSKYQRPIVNQDTKDNKAKKLAEGTESFYKLTPFWTDNSPFQLHQWCDFTVDNIRYDSAEQYVLHQKALLFNDDTSATKLLRAKTRQKLKELDTTIKKYDNDVWEKNCDRIVRQANLAKFGQNIDLQEELFDTVYTVLVYTTVLDTFWGIGLDMTQEEARDPVRWKGRNRLGFILSGVRDELMKQRGMTFENPLDYDAISADIFKRNTARKHWKKAGQKLSALTKQKGAHFAK